MEILSFQELSRHTVLPFSVYNQEGSLLLKAGETLTPGKLLRLKYVSVLYKHDEALDLDLSLDFDFEDEQIQDFEEEEEEVVITEKNIVINNRFKKDINHIFSKLPELKEPADVKNKLSVFFDARDRILAEVEPAINKIIRASDIRMPVEDKFSHEINVAVLSILVAQKLKLKKSEIEEIALGALLHDIGKIKIPEAITTNFNPNNAQHESIMQLHTHIGYNIIKDDLQLSENTARIAFEHHEKNDGSGYPKGKSGELISLHSQIVSVCNHFDNFVTNANSSYELKSVKDILKKMLNIGSKWFFPNILYSFVHLASYNDTKSLDKI